MRPLRIFIGYDKKEGLAYQVLTHSILSRASGPVSFIPIVRHQVKEFHYRDRGEFDSTDFSITRFLTPFLSGYQGSSIYMDCDMLCLGDIYELVLELQSMASVWVVKHDYDPRTITKMDGAVQTTYPRKNWSSLMIFNNSKCAALTPYYVETATGLDLHRFHWIPNEEIGEIDPKWNWLVGEYEPYEDARLLHFTLGGPWFRDHECDPYCQEACDLWRQELKEMADAI